MAKTVAATAPSEARTVSPSPWRQALEDLRPVPGRAALTWRVALLCALVTGAGMMFHIPEAAISCYLVIFLMKPDAVVNTGTGIGFLILLPGLIALLVWIINLTSGSTAHIMAAIVISSILFLYLGAATQLGEQGSVAALIVAFLLTLIVQAPFGEAATFALREAWAMAAMPMILMIGFNLLLGFSPVALLRDKLRARLGAAAEALETGDATALRECLREGNGAFEPQALAARLLRLVPRAEARQIATDIRAGFALMLAVSALPAELRPDRRAALAAAIRAAHGALGEGLAPPPPNTGTRDLLADIDPAERAVWVALERLAGTPEPEVVPEPKVPFIAPDALSNPAYTRFALKTTAAAVICFLIYTAIDWQGIHTAMITCYVAALATTGETVHKLALRIVGCLIGAALGVAAIFFVIPHIDDIGSLMALVFFGCLVGAWVSTGPERISYAGVQVALAFLLTVLQGFGPSISLDTAQGRIFGILLGNLVVYLMFTRVWPAPVEGEVRAMFARALAGLARMARLAPASRANAVGGAAAVASLAGRRAARRSLGALVLGLALAGCASDATNMAPVAPDQPWTPRGDEETGTWSLARPGPRTRSDGVADFAIPMDSERAQLVLTPGGDPERSYALPELIDLAQRTNPATRTAWQQARQAALAVGMVEATYLPVITAGVIGGAQELTLPLPEALGENISVENRQQGSAQILALQWLLFDFGQREALATAAKHAAVAGLLRLWCRRPATRFRRGGPRQCQVDTGRRGRAGGPGPCHQHGDGPGAPGRGPGRAPSRPNGRRGTRRLSEPPRRRGRERPAEHRHGGRGAAPPAGTGRSATRAKHPTGAVPTPRRRGELRGAAGEQGRYRGRPGGLFAQGLCRRQSQFRLRRLRYLRPARHRATRLRRRPAAGRDRAAL